MDVQEDGAPLPAHRSNQVEVRHHGPFVGTTAGDAPQVLVRGLARFFPHPTVVVGRGDVTDPAVALAHRSVRHAQIRPPGRTEHLHETERPERCGSVTFTTVGTHPVAPHPSHDRPMYPLPTAVHQLVRRQATRRRCRTRHRHQNDLLGISRVHCRDAPRLPSAEGNNDKQGNDEATNAAMLRGHSALFSSGPSVNSVLSPKTSAILSFPAPPKMMSEPSPPSMVSAPLPPSIRSSPASP